jgi:hypothetical protein
MYNNVIRYLYQNERSDFNMDNKEIILALMELARDMGDPTEGDEEFDSEVEILTDDLDNIEGTALYALLERVVEMNG